MKSPAAMPDMYVAFQHYEIKRNDFAAPEASGRIGGVQSGFPLWETVVTLGRMPEEWSDEWRSFYSGMRGQTRRCYVHDLSRYLPKQYIDTGLPIGFSGAASSWSSTINADGDCELTLHGLPVGFVLSKVDYVGFRWTATEDAVAGLEWRAAVRIQDGGTADGSGNVTVIVEPPIPDAVPSDAEAHLDEPGCTMVLVSDQSSLEPYDRLRSIQGGQLSFIQDIRA